MPLLSFNVPVNPFFLFLVSRYQAAWVGLDPSVFKDSETER
jgi:hypothetical protein